MKTKHLKSLKRKFQKLVPLLLLVATFALFVEVEKTEETSINEHRSSLFKVIKESIEKKV